MRRPAGGRDNGFTFVEVVVTVVLMGVVLVPILASVRSTIRASAVSREAAQVETLLVNVVDRVNRAQRSPALKCDLSSPAIAAVETQGWDPGLATIEQWYLETDGTWVQGSGASPACPTGGFRNGLVQKVTVSVSGPQHGVTRTIEVVKSDV